MEPRSPGRSPANRSLERGLLILRAFRPGSTLLGNGELAERTGLARATVSRLTQTLTAAGFLQHDAKARAYRLGPPVLSVAYAMRQGSEILRVALPLMRETAENQRINVGLAAADGEEMVYLESVRRHRAHWPQLAREIRESIAAVERQGWCRASWQPGVLALAAPLEGVPGYVMNLSLATDRLSDAEIRASLAPLLKKLVQQVSGRL